MSKFKKVVDSLKKGLTEQEKVEIAAAFDEAVEARAKIEVTAIMEAKVNAIVVSITEDLQEKSGQILESLKVSISEDVVALEENIDKYVQFFVRENLPVELVETVRKGIRFSKYFEAVELGMKEDIISEADVEVRKRVASLTEEVQIHKDKYSSLFERMVENSQQFKEETMKRRLFEDIAQYPDNIREVMEKIAETSVDYGRLNEDNLEDTVTGIADSVKKAMKKRQIITEDDKPAQGKGQVDVPIIEDADPGVPADPDVSLYDSILESAAPHSD